MRQFCDCRLKSRSSRDRGLVRTTFYRRLLDGLRNYIAFRTALTAGVIIFPAALTPLRAEENVFEIGQLKVERPRIRTSVEDKRRASFFMDIHNNSDAPDKLIGVNSSNFEKAVLHIESGRIVTPNGIVIPPHASVLLEPGRPFVSLEETNAIAHVGSLYELTLIFEKAGVVKVLASVESGDAARMHDEKATERWKETHTKKSDIGPALQSAAPGSKSVSEAK